MRRGPWLPCPSPTRGSVPRREEMLPSTSAESSLVLVCGQPSPLLTTVMDGPTGSRVQSNGFPPSSKCLSVSNWTGHSCSPWPEDHSEANGASPETALCIFFFSFSRNIFSFSRLMYGPRWRSSPRLPLSAAVLRNLDPQDRLSRAGRCSTCTFLPPPKMHSR